MSIKVIYCFKKESFDENTSLMEDMVLFEKLFFCKLAGLLVDILSYQMQRSVL